MLTLIYTSGTTGPPKGVQLTHDNLMQAGALVRPDHPVPQRRRAWSRTCRWRTSPSATAAHYLPLDARLHRHLLPNPREVVGYLPEVRPTWFFAVPRIWEKLKAAIEAGMEAEQDEERKQATQWAHRRRAAQGARRAGRRGGARTSWREEYAKADELVLSKIRAALGPRRAGVAERRAPRPRRAR